MNYLYTLLFFAALLFGCTKADKGVRLKLSGKELYEYSCGRCHGMDGNPIISFGKLKPVDFSRVSSPEALPINVIKDAIKNGRRNMPPFRAVIDDKDMDKIANHIYSLAKGKTRA